MRLLRAELRRLRRPLVGWTFVGLLALAMYLTRDGAFLSFGKLGGSGAPSLHDQAFTSPTGIGVVAADLMASLPGAMVVLLLAGAHVAGEWSGETLKSLLLQEGRRRRWLAGKLTSLFVAAVAFELALWLALAGWAFALRRYWPPTRQLSARQGFALALPAAGRSLLLLLAFAALGCLAAVVTRSMLGTLLGGALAIVLPLGLSNIAFTRVLPGYWVVGWMRFTAPGQDVTYALWNDKFPPGVPYPSVWIGAAGVLGLLAATASLAAIVFARTDVT